MVFDLVIKNGIIVGNDNLAKGDIYIKDGKIAMIAQDGLNLNAKEEIDATDKMIFPGGIDCHAHLNDPGYNWREDYLHGSVAAAAGGITTIIDMPLQNEPALTTKDIYYKKEEHLKNKSVVDYAFWGGLVDNNLEDLEGLYHAGVIGLKAFIGPVSQGYSSINMAIARDAMKLTSPLNLLLGFHCEDYSIIQNNERKAMENNRITRKDYLESRPVIAELLATKNIIDLARETGGKVHICHVSDPLVAEEIKKAKAQGINITGETCAHYLVFTEEDVIKNGAIFKCAPPLRRNESKERLWEYVIDGTLDCIASDHSPAAPEEKSEKKQNIFEVWGGISGIQSTFQVMFNEVVHKRKLSPTLITKRLCRGPAKVLGLYPKKGTLEIGGDGDLVIVDPERKWEITPESLYYKNKISAFVGQKGKGLPIKTIVRGKVVYDEGKTKVSHGYGRLIKRNRNLC